MKPTLVDLEIYLARHRAQVLNELERYMRRIERVEARARVLLNEFECRKRRIKWVEAEVERLAKEARAMLTQGRARRAVDRLVACNPTERWERL